MKQTVNNFFECNHTDHKKADMYCKIKVKQTRSSNSKSVVCFMMNAIESLKISAKGISIKCEVDEPSLQIHTEYRLTHCPTEHNVKTCAIIWHINCQNKLKKYQLIILYGRGGGILLIITILRHIKYQQYSTNQRNISQYYF